MNHNKAVVGVNLILAGMIFLFVSAKPARSMSETAIGQDLLQQAFQKHVADGLVDYMAIAADKDFKAYLKWLKDFDPATISDGNGQMAFWINAYNALAIKSVLRASPEIVNNQSTVSSRDLARELRTRRDGKKRPVVALQLVASVLDDASFFSKRELPVAGKRYTLNQIEKEIIFPKFGETRLHFALVCAALSCPELPAEIYTAENLPVKMEEVTRKFLTNTSKNYLDRGEKVLYLSQIFNWYRDDFDKHGSVISFILPYLDQATRAFIEENKVTIKYLEYDWALNLWL